MVLLHCDMQGQQGFVPSTPNNGSTIGSIYGLGFGQIPYAGTKYGYRLNSDPYFTRNDSSYATTIGTGRLAPSITLNTQGLYYSHIPRFNPARAYPISADSVTGRLGIDTASNGSCYCSQPYSQIVFGTGSSLSSNFNFRIPEDTGLILNLGNGLGFSYTFDGTKDLGFDSLAFFTGKTTILSADSLLAIFNFQTGSGFFIDTGIHALGSFQYSQGATPGAVLTSADANGNAVWKPGIHTDSIHISPAQLAAINVTPIQLEPGIPGGNYQILAISEDYTFGTLAYSGGALMVTQDNTLSGALFTDQNFISGASFNATYYFLPIPNTTSGPANAVRGDPLTIYSGNPYTVGDSLDVFVTYIVR